MTEAEALKRFIPILGRISLPGERATITRNILERIAGTATSIMGVSHKHAGALAWPNDQAKATAFESALDMAVDTGDFVSLLHRVDRRHFQIEELCAWPGCPKVAIDSPLVFWLGDALTEAPEQNQTTPAPVVAVGASLTHSTRARRNTLTPVIELAQAQCRNPKDTAEVWAALQVLAEKKHPPLIGGTEDGLQYYEAGEAAIFKRKSLGKRLAR